MHASQVAAVVLAAGAGSRYVSADPRVTDKLLVELDGKPLLQHVLDLVAAAGLARIVVVTGPESGALERGLRWRDERLVRNPSPEHGLSGSVRIGLETLQQEAAWVDAALIMLGDQPRVPAAVIEALLRAADDAGTRPIFAPRYAGGGASNPVVVRRDGWPLAATLSGDRGFGPLIEARPELVLQVPVEGSVEDVDTPADLAAIERSASFD